MSSISGYGYGKVLTASTDGQNIVGQTNNIGDPGQQWSVQDAVANIYVTEVKSGRVVEVEGNANVKSTEYTGQIEQQWFWSGDVIRSSKLPGLALTAIDESMSKFTLEVFTDKSSQHFSMNNSYLTMSNHNNSNQVHNWSIGLERAYFIISSKLSGLVVNARTYGSNQILMSKFNGLDNQHWFWEGDTIRSKMHPNKVIGLHEPSFISRGWGEIQLQDSIGKDYQRWKISGENIISHSNDAFLDVYGESERLLKKVGGYKEYGALNQKWSISDPERNYFTISNRETAHVLSASNEASIHMWNYHGGDNQFFFWDGDAIRSKMYSSMVLTLDVNNFEQLGCGKVVLNPYQGGPNQKWSIFEDSVISGYKDLRLQVDTSSRRVGAIINGCPEKSKLSQKFSLNAGKRIYFMIQSQLSGRVFDAKLPGLNDYSQGKESQHWFWDVNFIRSKAYPDFLLELKFDNHTQLGKIYVGKYHGRTNQQWSYLGGNVISGYKEYGLFANLESSKLEARELSMHTDSTSQKWSLAHTERNYFTINSQKNSKTLDLSPPPENAIHIWNYHENDCNFWFWDGNFIRSKKYPDKVITLDKKGYENNGWGRIYLAQCYGGDNQKWTYNMDKILSDYKQLSLDIRDGWANGDKVGCQDFNDGLSQKFLLNFNKRQYFLIKSSYSNKVVDATTASKVHMWGRHGRSNQQWFWDQDIIRSKKYPHKVLELNTNEYYKQGWATVALNSYTGRQIKSGHLKMVMLNPNSKI